MKERLIGSLSGPSSLYSAKSVCRSCSSSCAVKQKIFRSCLRIKYLFPPFPNSEAIQFVKRAFSNTWCLISRFLTELVDASPCFCLRRPPRTGAAGHAAATTTTAAAAAAIAAAAIAAAARAATAAGTFDIWVDGCCCSLSSVCIFVFLCLPL